jgi:hypothetical protein
MCKPIEVNLNFGISEVFNEFLLLNFLVNDGPVVLHRELGVVVDVQFEVDVGLLDLLNLFLVVELLEVRMFQDILDGNPLPRLKLQSSGYKVQ